MSLITDNISNGPVISRAALDDIPEMCALSNRVFGENPKASESFSKWIQDEKFFVSLARMDGKLAGFIAAHVTDQPKLERFKSFGPAAVAFLEGQISGHILSLVVEPSLRGRGIAASLSRQLLEWFRAVDCPILCGVNWANGRAENSRHLFEKFGFTLLGESPTFLSEMMAMTGSVCSICGADCVCMANLYVREI